MNPRIWHWLVAVVALLAMLPSYAEKGHRGMPPPEVGAGLAPMQRQVPYQSPSDAQLRPEPQDPAQPMRMSPEERRQLRRDIHDAGRELYRRDVPRPPP